MTTDNTSRFRFTPLFVDDRAADERDRVEETTFFGARKPVRYIDDPDTIIHMVTDGDTLQTLANRYYQGFKNPANMWWVIAEFQTPPIVDPTIKLQSGAVVRVPSVSLVGRLINEETLTQ